MINANIKTPASKRKKYMSVFGGKNAPTKPLQVNVANDSNVLGGETDNHTLKQKNIRQKPIKKKVGWNYIASGIILLMLVIGGGAGFWLTKQNQDIRQQASEVYPSPSPRVSPSPAVSPSPTTTPGSCSLSFFVPEPSPSPSVSPSPSPSVSPSPSPSVSPSPSPSVSPSPSPSVSPSPSPSPTTYSCDSECETNEQCESANADYICYQNSCRLDSNPGNAECQVKPSEYACNSGCETNEQCESANGNYICYQSSCRLDSNPSASNCQSTTYNPPVIGCNDTCENNGDCSSSDQICYNNSCRLATNPTSNTCSVAQTNTYQTTKGGQPVLPEELPESGSNIIVDWFKAGIGVVGIGAVLLLLL